MSRLRKKWWWVALAIPFILVSVFIFWSLTPLGPMPEALEALQSDELVQVEDGSWLIFQASDITPETGFILYPGGRVDYRSYAPAARAIAAQGYLVIIPAMPLNLAVLSPGVARKIIDVNPGIQSWAIGGHSLGGSMAANYAHNHPDQIQGLILWASYPASADNLTTKKLAVASIFGTLDGVATVDEVLAGSSLLPASTIWVPVEGGNHAQFGWYGDQPGDNPAAIDREEQQRQVIEASLTVLEQISNHAD